MTKLFKYTFLSILFLLMSCKTEQKTSKITKLESPLKGVNIEFVEYEFNAEKQNEIVISSGTKIIIPANVLLDEAGNLVKGNVKLLYREFHDAVDVFLSGIPMDFMSDGEKRTMQTAGMFDIKCKQDNSELKIKPGGKIKIDFASQEDGIDYNLFKLKDNKEWMFLDYVEPVANSGANKIQEEIKAIENKLKKKQKTRFFISNFDAVVDVSYEKYMEDVRAKNYKRISNRIKSYGIDYYKFYIDRDVNLDGVYYNGNMVVWKVLGKSFPRWTKEKGYSANLTLISPRKYKCEIRNDEKVFETIIYAECPSKYVFNFSAEKWQKEYNKVSKEIAKKEIAYREALAALQKKMEQQAKVIRSFELSGFGIYNFDKLMRLEDKIEVLADFEMMGVEGLDMIYFFPEDNKTLVKYPKKAWESLVLLPNNAGRFVTVMEDNKIGVFDAQRYLKINFDSLKVLDKPNYKFELVTTITANNKDDIVNIISS